LFISLLSMPVAAKPVASRTASMTSPTSGVRMTFQAEDGKKTAYGFALPLTITRSDVGKFLEVVAKSPKPLTIEMWTGGILNPASRTDWVSSRRHKFLGNSGAPSTTPTFKWMAEKEGEYTLLFLDVVPEGTKTGTFLFTYGKELRKPTAIDQAEWDNAVAEYNAKLEKQAEERRNTWVDFQATATDEKPISASMYRDKVLLILFFAASDTASREEMPTIISLYDKYRGKGFEVIGISSDESAETLNQYLQTLGIKWRIIYDVATDTTVQTLDQRYNVTEIPYSFLLDGKGMIIGRNLKGKDLEEAVAKAVAANQAAIIAAAEKEIAEKEPEKKEKPESPAPEKK
jgi:peroxiredoxin